MKSVQTFLTIANSVYAVICFASLIVLFGLHAKSEGRTSPIAAAMFVIFGPVLGVLIISWHAFREAMWRENMITDALTYQPAMNELGIRTVSTGLVAAAIAAVAAAIMKRDEWFNHSRRVK